MQIVKADFAWLLYGRTLQRIYKKESEDWLKGRCKISIVFYWKCLYNTKGRMHRKMVRSVDEVNICNSLRCL